MLPPILCISNTEWDTVAPTNRQQLMRRFAQRTQVAVVEAPLPVLGSFIGHSRGRLRQLGWRRDGEVCVLQAWDWPPYPLTRRSVTLSRMVDGGFRAYVMSQWRHLGWQRPILWLYSPDGGDLLGQFAEALALYHCVDDYRAIETYNHYRRAAAYDERKREEYLVRAAQMVVVTAPSLYNRWRPYNPQTHLMPNVADTSLFQQALDVGPIHPQLAAIPEPRIGYVGALDSYKVDFDLLRAIAQQQPDWHIVCIGPVGIGDGTRRRVLPQEPNIHYVDTLAQHELPMALRGCAVCLIPYHLNAYTAGVSPLKLYEYLAAGRPVVATPLPALQSEVIRGVFLADPEPIAFVEQIRRGIAVGQQECVAISLAALAHSWERRVDDLEALLIKQLAAPASSLPGKR